MTKLLNVEPWREIDRAPGETPVKIRLGDKLVIPSKPYQPVHLRSGDFVGREREMTLIAAAWIGGPYSPPLSPLLVGDPGVGKNRIVYELSRRTGRALFMFQGHEDVTAEDLACAVRFSDGPDAKMDYVASPLVTAMARGGICFIDEIGKIRPRALSLLVSVLDERRYIDSTLLGERVYAHPAFRFVAATNTGEVNALPEFIRSRMRPVISVGYPPRREIERVIARQFPDLRELDQLVGSFWCLWENKKEPRAPTPRDAIYLFTLAASLAEFERANQAGRFRSAGPGQPFPTERHEGPPAIEPRHLETAFENLFSEADQ